MEDIWELELKSFALGQKPPIYSFPPLAAAQRVSSQLPGASCFLEQCSRGKEEVEELLEVDGAEQYLSGCGRSPPGKLALSGQGQSGAVWKVQGFKYILFYSSVQ